MPSNKDQAPIPEGMRGAEVEKRLNGQVNFYILVLLVSIFRKMLCSLFN